MSMASAMSSLLLFKKWPYLIASSTVASLTSTFLGWNLLKAFAYSPFTGRSSGLILSLYCDGCHSTQGRIQDLIRGGPQIVTGLKLPFWGLSFVEFWCWGLIFWWSGGGLGPRGPPLDPPLVPPGSYIAVPC